MTPKFKLGRDFCTIHLPPSLIISCLIVRKLSCWQTKTQTNRRRWKHPTVFATLRRWVVILPWNTSRRDRRPRTGVYTNCNDVRNSAPDTAEAPYSAPPLGTPACVMGKVGGDIRIARYLCGSCAFCKLRRDVPTRDVCSLHASDAGCIPSYAYRLYKVEDSCCTQPYAACVRR